MAKEVRAEFLDAWRAYKQYAWGHDELKPLTRGYQDLYAQPLLITAVDALDTMILMGLDDEAGKTREFIVQNLSLDKDMEVNTAEVSARVLGGLISSYQMTGDKRLLNLAEELGSRMVPAFNSPTGMPYVNVNLKTGATSGKEASPADMGALLIEFGALTKLTGKPIFYEKAKHALVEVYNRRSKIGLVGSRINVETGQWIDITSQIGEGADAYYQSLLNASILFDDKDCRRMWKSSLEAVNKYLPDSIHSGLWYGQAEMNTGRRVGTRYSAVSAFFAASLARANEIDRARKLQESSYKMWTGFGVEPEEIDYPTFKALRPAYPLRSEIMESAYYLYFYTKESRYLEMASTFIGSLVHYSKTGSGYAGLRSVETREKDDRMESYFLARAMKYLYLTFAPRGTLDLNLVTFSSGGHPIQRAW
jgi:ER degradation enhancer, mannosidase alpha-like 2